MKTIINFSRKNILTVVFLMIICLISSNAISQLAFTNPSLNEIRKNIYIAGKADIIVAFTDFNEIKPVEDNFIEEWMKNPFIITENSEFSPEMLPEVFIEEDLEIENWMTEPVRNTDIDEEITIEHWMTAPAEWYAKK